LQHNLPSMLVRKIDDKTIPCKDNQRTYSFSPADTGDICGLIQSPCGPFRYFIVLVDASTYWSHVCLLSTRNVVFPKLLTQIIKLRARHLDYPIKSLRMDNIGEFTLKTFDDYSMSFGIEVEHLVLHVHTHPKFLAEAFIKCLQLIAMFLVIRTKRSIFVGGLHNFACNQVGPLEAHCHQTIFCVTTGD